MITETKTRHVEPDITVVEIAGRLNLGNTLLSIENTLKRLVDEGARKLVVDLSNLIAIDSSGIGMLVACFAHMEQQGGLLRVAGSQGNVLKVFETVHLDRIVPLRESAEAAFAD